MSGAGKTTVCAEFCRAGFEIIDCDFVARAVVQKGKPALGKIAERFGKEYIIADGELDRKALGALVFSDREKLEELNRIMYPYITYEVIGRINGSDAEYVLLDAPTLFESGMDYICDGVVCVVCDKEKALRRIMRRDGLDEQAAADRLASQHDADYYREKSKYCIENNADTAALVDVVRNTVEQIKETA
ncbi:MAG: dephospho-CoA kinase [Eubacterium sp.]|nr:dephospho-CoA kinase [Eubacterium sp.]